MITYSILCSNYFIMGRVSNVEEFYKNIARNIYDAIKTELPSEDINDSLVIRLKKRVDFIINKITIDTFKIKCIIKCYINDETIELTKIDLRSIQLKEAMTFVVKNPYGE